MYREEVIASLCVPALVGRRFGVNIQDLIPFPDQTLFEDIQTSRHRKKDRKAEGHH
jgi:hypothetical protein